MFWTFRLTCYECIWFIILTNYLCLCDCSELFTTYLPHTRPCSYQAHIVSNASNICFHTFLMTQAFDLMNIEETADKYKWKSATVVASLFVFYVWEQAMRLQTEWRKVPPFSLNTEVYCSYTLVWTKCACTLFFVPVVLKSGNSCSTPTVTCWCIVVCTAVTGHSGGANVYKLALKKLHKFLTWLKF